MIIAVVADVHVGNHTAFSGETVGRMNERCRSIIKTLDLAFEAAHEAFASDFVIAGDLFDTDHPYPDMIGAVLEVFLKWKAKGMNIHLLVGNHDQHSSAPGDNALTPFKSIAAVYEEPFVLEREPCILFLPYGHKLPDRVEGVDYVIAHHGVADDATHPIKASAPFVRKAKDLQAWMDTNEVSGYLSGDWHEHQRWGNIVQIGALAPVNWTNRAYVPKKYDPYGSVIFADFGSLKRQVIHGPRFMRADTSAEALLLYNKATAEGMWPYIDLIAEAVDLPKHVMQQVRVSPSAVQKEAQVAKVAQALRTGSSIEDEIREYVDNDPETPAELKAQVVEATIKSIRRAKAQDTG
jgi:hypothetical protein